MFNALKILDLLIFIIEYKNLSNDVLIKKIQVFRRDHKKVVIIIKIYYQKHACKLIENYINTIKIYKILEKNFIFKGADIVNDTFHKLFNIRLKNYFSVDAYVNNFRNTINKLKTF